MVRKGLSGKTDISGKIWMKWGRQTRRFQGDTHCRIERTESTEAWVKRLRGVFEGLIIVLRLGGWWVRRGMLGDWPGRLMVSISSGKLSSWKILHLYFDSHFNWWLSICISIFFEDSKKKECKVDICCFFYLPSISCSLTTYPAFLMELSHPLTSPGVQLEHHYPLTGGGFNLRPPWFTCGSPLDIRLQGLIWSNETQWNYCWEYWEYCWEY